MNINVETEREEDGRWIAEAIDLPGVLVYSATEEGAVLRAQALALRVIADKLDNGEYVPGLTQITFTPLRHATVAVC